jgi:hypothetical protein
VPPAFGVSARQRHQVGVTVFVKKEITEVKGVTDLEIGAVTGFAMRAFGGHLLHNPVPVEGDQAD